MGHKMLFSVIMVLRQRQIEKEEGRRRNRNVTYMQWLIKRRGGGGGLCLLHSLARAFMEINDR